MSRLLAPWWFLVRFYECFTGNGGTWSSRWAEYRGYRRQLGGRWGKWECTCLGLPFTVWWPSACSHYPPPPLVNTTEPIETEEYA